MGVRVRSSCERARVARTNPHLARIPIPHARVCGDSDNGAYAGDGSRAPDRAAARGGGDAADRAWHRRGEDPRAAGSGPTPQPQPRVGG
eukprot:2344999-Pleurochrysis_carterae.AAC.1